MDDSGGLSPLLPEDVKSAWQSLRSKYPRDFEPSPEQLLAWTGREAESCYERARAYAESNQWTEAIAECSRALVVLGNSSSSSGVDTNFQGELYDARARHYLRVAEADKALADFGKAHQVSANYLEAYHARGHAYFATNQFRSALADFEEALKRVPQDSTNLAHFYFDRAHAFDRVGEHAKAVPDYEKAIALRPDFDSCYNNLAWDYAVGPKDFRSPEKALPLALKAVELTRTNSIQLNTLGVVYYRLGQLANAIKTLEEGIKANKEGGWAEDFLFLAMAHQRLGEAAKAQAYFDKAVKRIEAQPPLFPEAKEELDSFRAEAEAVLGKTKSK